MSFPSEAIEFLVLVPLLLHRCRGTKHWHLLGILCSDLNYSRRILGVEAFLVLPGLGDTPLRYTKPVVAQLRWITGGIHFGRSAVAVGTNLC